VAYNEHAVIQSERAGDLRGRSAAAGNLGYAYLEVGAYPEAERALDEALASAARLGLPRVVATAQQNLGLAIARRGAFDAAVELERASYQSFEQQGDFRRAGCSLLYRACIELAAGRLADAEASAGRAAEMLANNPPLRCNALAVMAQIALEQGDAARAYHDASQAHALFLQLGSIDEGESRVRLVYAEALHASGHVEHARSAIADARASLSSRAAKIQDETRRAAFLDAIPEHARTLALARAWGL
jgi:tetratricopeptide (TPR) repeat protein